MGRDITIDTKDLAEAIARSNELAAENNKKFMELMKESSESHQKQMDLLNRQINESREESMRIMAGIKKEQKEGVELCSLKEPKFSLFYILVLLREKRNLNHCAVHLNTSKYLY